MKQILIKLFKTLLILTLLALVALLVFGAVMIVGWSWWVGCFILVGLAGLVLGMVVLRKYLKRRREKMFVHQIIEQDESMRRGLSPKEQDTAKELQARWKEAIEALRKSHLRKYGNPLYVLPWYMVIGESGSGKTTAIQSARLSSPFAEVSRTSGISGTRNCDWWFFEQAIFIDTAGRYAIPVDEGRDKDEWQKFLNLLARFRKKEPLNGLVVTVAADRLAQHGPEALVEDGRNIRRRIDELMRVLGAKFPVYVMVSKCDLIQGATQFCEALPENALNQAMGILNQQLDTDAGGLVGKAFLTVGDRLRDLRLLLLNQCKEHSAAASMLLFPEEFEKLQASLTAFVEGAFQENPYQETPLLRGIFFSSGRQEGTPFSHFLNALGLISQREVQAGTSKGLFLHDLFGKILPRDRLLFKPTRHMAQWQRVTRNMGLTAWIAVIVAVSGLLSYAFVKNLNALSDVRREFEKPALLQGELLADVMTMDRYRQALVKVEALNRNWWIPRMGLNASLDVEKRLKAKYVHLFESGFLKGFDDAMGERMTAFGSRTPDSVFGAHVAHLVRRINLLKTRLVDGSTETLSQFPQPVYGNAVLNRDNVIAEIQGMIGKQYLYAIAWRKDEDALRKEITHLQTWLKHLVSMPGMNLNWLPDWVNADPSMQAVHIEDFWGGVPPKDAPVIPAAFTRKGRQRINEAIVEIEAALFDPLLIARHKVEFAKWYHKRYRSTWQGFIQEFGRGESSIQNREQWQATVRHLPGDMGPFNALIRRIAEEFQEQKSETDVPSWAALAYDWQGVRKTSKSSAVIDPKQAGVLRKATRKVSAKVRKAERALGVKAARPAMNPEAQLLAAKAYLAYRQNLDAAAKSADSRTMAFQLASDMYQQDPATGESPLLAARRALNEMRSGMRPKSNDREAIFWRLLEGNIKLMHKFILRESACMLQAKWEKDVLLEVQGVNEDQDMGTLMMGGSGFATKFLQGPAAPFVTRGYQKGYYPKKLFGMSVPLQKRFMGFLTKGAKAASPRKSSYTVKIRAFPTDTNVGAQVRPHSTVLQLHCADGGTRLENLNYPVAKTYVWAPQSCGDVEFQISVGNLVLNKSYTGYNAFAKFLHDFKKGERVFKRNEFPAQEADLRRIGIEYIKAKYQFQGHRPALTMLYAAPGRPPRKIVACWDQ